MADRRVEQERSTHEESLTGLGAAGDEVSKEFDRHMTRVHEIMTDFARRRETTARARDGNGGAALSG
jgi:hypothetical protein